MLIRQRVLLQVLKAAERPLSSEELVNWAYLLRDEPAIDRTSTFYDFFSNGRGPHSFTLAREIDQLVDAGHLSRSANHVDYLVVADQVIDLPKPLSQELVAAVKRLRKASPLEIEERVGERACSLTPKHTTRRDYPTGTIFTAGYEGLQVETFLGLLLCSGVERIVDVRRNPVARKFGFHKGTLKRLSESVSIEYTHLPELGIASDERRGLDQQSDYDRLFEKYRRETLTGQRLLIDRLGETLRKSRSVLVCYESKPCRCHRSHLANDVSKRFDLPIVDLEA